MVLNPFFLFSSSLQMIQLTSVLALSVEIVQQACTMALYLAKAARASSSAVSAISGCTAAAVTRTARCHASSATAASTAACSSVCRWGWTAKVKCGHLCQFRLMVKHFLPTKCIMFYFSEMKIILATHLFMDLRSMHKKCRMNLLVEILVDLYWVVFFIITLQYWYNIYYVNFKLNVWSLLSESRKK